MKSLKYDILRLRAENKTYNEIKNILKCSIGAISYNCADGEKEKNKKRQKRHRDRIKNCIKCVQCTKWKKREKFSFRNRKLKIRKLTCKDCDKKYKNKYYKANRDELIAYSTRFTRSFRVRNKQFVWDYLKEHPCVDCDESDPIVLEFDHRTDSNKVADVSKLVASSSSLQKIIDEIKKCDVRCANCHKRKTAERGDYHRYIVK